MNVKRSKSVAGKVRKQIVNGGPSKVWTFDDFKGMPYISVAAELSRLSREGVIQRLNRGTYYVGSQADLAKLESPVVAQSMAQQSTINVALAKELTQAIAQVLVKHRVKVA